MEKLIEAYKAINKDAEIELQESDSTTGMIAAMEGTCDIGMASRELKDGETEGGLTAQAVSDTHLDVYKRQVMTDKACSKAGFRCGVKLNRTADLLDISIV